MRALLLAEKGHLRWRSSFSIVRLSQLSLVILSTISLLVVSSSHGAPFHRRTRRFIASDVTALVSTAIFHLSILKNYLLLKERWPLLSSITLICRHHHCHSLLVSAMRLVCSMVAAPMARERRAQTRGILIMQHNQHETIQLINSEMPPSGLTSNSLNSSWQLFLCSVSASLRRRCH